MSQELHRSIGNYYDHYPTTSPSNNVAATTFINLTSQNNSSRGLEQTILESSSSALPTGGHRPTSNLSTATPIALSNQVQPAGAPPSPPPINILSSFLPSSILRKASRRRGHTRSQSQSQSQQGQSSSKEEPSKPGTTATTQPAARASRSSLQLGRRASQLFNHSPFSHSSSATTATGGGAVGPLDEIYLQPNPMFLSIDKEQQQHMNHRNTAHSRDQARNSAMTMTTQTRQDEGRMQLDKDRAYMKSHKLRTWTKSKLLLLVANTLVSVQLQFGCFYKQEMTLGSVNSSLLFVLLNNSFLGTRLHARWSWSCRGKASNGQSHT